MQRFVRKVFVFFLPIALLSGAYEVTLRHSENPYSYKNSWLTNNCSGIELLAIGSSHCLNGINPDFFSLSSFNAGHGAQSIKYDNLIFNKFIGKMDSLKVLVVTISYGDPIYFIEDKKNASSIIKNYTLYYNLPSNNLKSHSEILNGIDFDAVSEILSRRTLITQNEEKGFFADATNHENDRLTIELASKRAKEQTVDINGPLRKKLIKNYYLNQTYMKQMINICNAKKIHVILLTTPTHKLFRAHINNEEWLLTTSFCNQLSREFENVSYLNLFEDSRFIDGDYFDVDHLNLSGATKLSKILNEYIKSQLNN